MLTKARGGRRCWVSEFTNLYLEEFFAKFPCRKQLRFASHCVYRSFPVFSSFPCSSIAVGDSCSHKESLSRTVLRKTALVEVQQDDNSPINLDQKAIFNEANNGAAYANPELGLEIQ